ncbi:MAG: endonuclease MutS2 [Clostridia bacterium]|nr:endonuclease MutS2 [Clostridia bacterium]
MDRKYLQKLEFDKALEILKKYTQSKISDSFIDLMIPSDDFLEVRSLLAETGDAEKLITRKGSPPLAGVTDVTRITARLRLGASLNNSELLSVRDNLYIAGRMQKYLSEDNDVYLQERNIARDKLADLFSQKALENEIQRCIISEEEMADDASPALKSIRRAINNKQDQVRNKLNDYIKSAKYSKFIQDNIITMRNGRYVIPVKQEYRFSLKGLVHDTSSSGSTLYIEPMDIVNLNNEIRELTFDEKNEMDRILALLSDEARKYVDGLNTNFNLMVHADVVFAKASMGLNENFMVPVVSADKRIRLVKARHPLIDPGKVVPIDFHIGDTFRTLVITGPNTGGKTVSLKTVGLLTLMAQAGLPIPASEGTEIAVFKEVFADIGDEQSIEQNLSTFSSHMTNIISILKKCSQDSLVLLDELGAGTDPTEGSALALAIIERLMSLQATTVATTHYQQIKMYASVTEGIENASCEFDVKTLQPTYRLLIGVPGKSNALYISRRLGLDDSIINDARSFIDGDNLDYEDVILSLEKSRQRIEKEKIKTIEGNREIDLLKRQFEKKLKSLESDRNKILNDAKAEAKGIIEQSRRSADEFLEELEKMKKSGEITGSARIEAAFRTKYKQVLEENMTPPPVMTSKDEASGQVHDILPGDDVMIIDIHQPAVVLEPPDRNNEVMVQAGIMKIKVHSSNISLRDEMKKNRERLVNAFTVKKDTKLELELDIRGLASDEIDMKIEKFIDNAAMQSLEEVYIIHGKGTGILRSAVHRLLGSNPNVDSFRLGKYGEGETGVTVVRLKQ